MMFLIILIQLVVGFTFFICCNKPESSIKDVSSIVSVSFLLGFFIHTFFLLITDLIGLKISLITVLISLLIPFILSGLIFKVRCLKTYSLIRSFQFKLTIYDLFILLLSAYLIYPSIWNAYYLPVMSYDSLVGIDLASKYAIKEGVINSSAFNLDTDNVSNQLYYAPMTFLAQVIYKTIGYSFGKVWLSIVYCSVLVFLYQSIKKNVHPVFSVILLIFFICIPEFYSYTFILQTDFINTAYFFIAIYFFKQYLSKKLLSDAYLSSIFFGASTWCRSETVIFIGGIVGFWYLLRLVQKKKPIIAHYVIIMLPSIILFGLWNFIYGKLVFSRYPKNQLVIRMIDFSELGKIFNSMNDYILNVNYWGYIVILFFALLAISLLYSKKQQPLEYISIILLLYITYALMVFFFPSVIIKATFRRGFFKFLPIFLLLISEFEVLKFLSNKLSPQKYKP